MEQWCRSISLQPVLKEGSLLITQYFCYPTFTGFYGDNLDNFSQTINVGFCSAEILIDICSRYIEAVPLG